jgi:peptide/nickel transport system ATP-binding protein
MSPSVNPANIPTIVTPLLLLRDLRVTLPTARGPAEALRGISFTMDRGQTLGLIGESGCGKSLTALSIMGLLPELSKVSGSIQLNGEELLGLPDQALGRLRGARMAMIFQEPMTALNPLHTIAHQIAEPLRLHKQFSREQAKAGALELLERVQLPRAKERLSAYPHQLSGGQRQRVMIAIALACGPDLLIADEPTTALDVTVQKDVLQLIRNLVLEDGMGLLMISHNLGLMQDQVERIMVMYGGAVVESAPTTELFRERKHPYTQGLFASRPRLGLARGTRLATIPGRVPELADLPKGCAFAERCPKVVESCLGEQPPLLSITPVKEIRVNTDQVETAPAVAAQTSALQVPHRMDTEHQVRCPRWNL